MEIISASVLASLNVLTLTDFYLTSIHKTINYCDNTSPCEEMHYPQKAGFQQHNWYNQTPSLLSIHLQTYHFAEYIPHLLFVQVSWRLLLLTQLSLVKLQKNNF